MRVVSYIYTGVASVCITIEAQQKTQAATTMPTTQTMQDGSKRERMCFRCENEMKQRVQLLCFFQPI